MFLQQHWNMSIECGETEDRKKGREREAEEKGVGRRELITSEEPAREGAGFWSNLFVSNAQEPMYLYIYNTSQAFCKVYFWLVLQWGTGDGQVERLKKPWEYLYIRDLLKYSLIGCS